MSAKHEAPNADKRSRRMHLSTLRIMGVAAVVAAFVTMIGFTSAWGMMVDRMEATASTNVFSAMNLKDLNDKSFTSENLKDARISIFNVWGTTCAPCVMEMPDLETLNHSYEAGQIQVIGLLEDSSDRDGTPIEENLATAREIVEKTGVTYPVLVLDQPTYAFISSTIVGTPTTFYVDQEGKILMTATGAESLEAMRGRVDKLLSEQAQQAQ